MSRVVTAAGVHGAFTIDDLDGFPQDSNRYELIEGSLHVTPAPIRMHQRVSMNLVRLLDAAAPADVELLYAPFGVKLGPDTLVEPDIVVTRVDAPGDKLLEAAPLLVIEILSPRTRLYDLGTKRLVYREAGVGAYWAVDPSVANLIAWRWDGDTETEVAVEGDAAATLDWPFAVTVTPARLLLPGG